MTTREFIENNFGDDDGKEKWCSSVYKDAKGNMFSYGYHYPLLFKVGGYTFRNVAGYSVTTAKHINWSYGINAINVKLPSNFRLYYYQSDAENLKRIEEVLIEEATELTMQLAKKKRRDTRIFQQIERELINVSSTLEAIRG